MTGPAGNRLAEVDIEHDTAEIEQQRVGRTGGERGAGHAGGVRKTGGRSNGGTISVSTQLADSRRRRAKSEKCRKHTQRKDAEARRRDESTLSPGSLLLDNLRYLWARICFHRIDGSIAIGIELTRVES
jgi:hypothetical protein